MLKIIKENDEMKDIINNLGGIEKVFELLMNNKLKIKFPFYLIRATDHYAGNVSDQDNYGWVTGIYKWEDEYYVSTQRMDKNLLKTEDGMYKALNLLLKLKRFGSRSSKKANEYLEMINDYAGLSECRLVKINDINDLFID